MFSALMNAASFTIKIYKAIFKGIMGLFSKNKEVNDAVQQAQNETNSLNDFRYPPNNNNFQ